MTRARLLLAAGLAAVATVSVPAAHAAVRAGHPPVRAAVAGNPLAPAGGFQLFADGDATMVSSVAGPVAIDGTLATDLEFMSVAANTAGSYVVPGDQRPTGLVAGAVDLSGRIEVLTVGSQAYAKIGDLRRLVVTDTDQSGHTDADTQIVETTYGSTPRVELGVSQPVASVGPVRPLNFAAAFATLSATARGLDGCAATGTVDEDSRTLDIVPGTLNKFDIDVDDKLWNGPVHLSNPPGPDTPLVVNLRGTTGQAGVRLGSLVVLPPQSQYVLYTYAGTGTLTVATDAFGSLLAPNANVVLDGAAVWGTLVAGGVTGGRFGAGAGFTTPVSCASPGPGGGYGSPGPPPGGPGGGYGG